MNEIDKYINAIKTIKGKCTKLGNRACFVESDKTLYMINERGVLVNKYKANKASVISDNRIAVMFTSKGTDILMDYNGNEMFECDRIIPINELMFNAYYKNEQIIYLIRVIDLKIITGANSPFENLEGTNGLATRRISIVDNYYKAIILNEIASAKHGVIDSSLERIYVTTKRVVVRSVAGDYRILDIEGNVIVNYKCAVDNKYRTVAHDIVMDTFEYINTVKSGNVKLRVTIVNRLGKVEYNELETVVKIIEGAKYTYKRLAAIEIIEN